jgi:threonine synthase
MDVGNPSNFERMMWLYESDASAMRRDVSGCRFADEDVRRTIERIHGERGYLLDPHSAIAYLGLKGHLAGGDTGIGIFLATAHPAKFREIVEPIIGRTVETPAPLADALARPRHILRIDATLDALAGALDA